MRITNLKIGVRLGIGFGFLLLLLVAIATLGTARLADLNKQMQDVVNDKYPKTVLANKIIDNLNLIARSSRNTLLMSAPEQIQKEIDLIAQTSKSNGDVLTKLDSVIDGDIGRALMKNIMDSRTRYNDSLTEVIRLVQDNDKTGATIFLLQTVRPIQQTYMKVVDDLIQHQNQLMHDAGEEVTREYLLARNLMVAQELGLDICSLCTACSGTLTLHRLAQDHAGDQQPVDLVGALEDPVDPLVAVEALGRVVADETIAAVDLHDLVDGLGQDLAAEDLGDAAVAQFSILYLARHGRRRYTNLCSSHRCAPGKPYPP